MSPEGAVNPRGAPDLAVVGVRAFAGEIGECIEVVEKLTGRAAQASVVVRAVEVREMDRSSGDLSPADAPGFGVF